MNEMKKEIKKEQEIENKIKKEHEMEREIERTVSDSRVETVHMVRPNHMNAAGRLFGGQLMQWLDEVAGLVAKRHIRGNVITASVDNLRFIHGAYQGEMVVIIGKATYVGNSSMEVRVDTYVEHLSDGMRYPINRAYFTMVGLDEKDKPCRIPRLTIKSEEEKAEWEAAEKRREMRMHRRKEGIICWKTETELLWESQEERIL